MKVYLIVSDPKELPKETYKPVYVQKTYGNREQADSECERMNKEYAERHAAIQSFTEVYWAEDVAPQTTQMSIEADEQLFDRAIDEACWIEEMMPAYVKEVEVNC